MRIFVDMDGTLAKWNNVAFEDLYKQGYYRNLQPDKAIIDEIKLFIEMGFDVYVLSAYLPDVKDEKTGNVLTQSYALEEKTEWIKEYLPELEKNNAIFVPYGTNKAEYLKENYSPIYSSDYLLDDYTKNLDEWKSYGGTGIKYRNGINGTKGTWKGLSVEYNEPNLLAVVPEANKIAKQINNKYDAHIDTIQDMYNLLNTIIEVGVDCVEWLKSKNFSSLSELKSQLDIHNYDYANIVENLIDIYLDDCTITVTIKDNQLSIPDIEIYSNEGVIANLSSEKLEKLIEDFPNILKESLGDISKYVIDDNNSLLDNENQLQDEQENDEIEME